MSDQQGYNPDKLTQDFQNASLGGAAGSQGQGQPQQQQQQQQQQYAAYGQQNYYNAGNAQAFVPQGGYQGQAYNYNQYNAQQPQQQSNQGYQGNYQGQGYNNTYNNNNNNNNNRGGYQNYNNNNNRGGYQNNNRGGYTNNTRGNYQNYNTRGKTSTGTQGMSLADFQKQQAASQSSLNAAPKPKLKLASSSTIKLPPKKEVTPVASKEASPAPAAVVTPVAAVVPEVAAPVEPKKEEPVVEEKKESTPAPAPVEEVKKESTPVPQPKSAASSVPVSATNSVREGTPSAVVGADALIKEQEDEVDEEVVNDLFGGKDHVSIIFMGHVDAGKSTMGGNLLYLTGSVDKRTIEKHERDAKEAGRQGWYLSWVMDTNKEERNDGKTIEVGKAYFETDKRRYTILDAPGHKMYVSEMIGGASQADVGILVISARKGEYETGFEKGGQTREHALLAKTQGVNKIVVVVNKMDDPTVAWSKERYTECITKLSAYLRGIGYAKEDIVSMPVSGYTGAGLKLRVDANDCPWYTGPSLLEYLDNMETVNRKINAPFMLPISGKMKDLGTVIEGKIESGHIKKGGNLIIMPNKTNVEILTVYNETEQECEAAYCGEQVRLRLKGVEEEDIQPGYVLSSPKTPVNTVTKFEAQIAIVELKSILSNGFSCVMHLHTAIEEVKFVELKHKLEKGTNRRSKKPPAFAKKGMKIIAVLEVSESVCAETYANYPQLGRFTLRDQGTTIAIGKITKLL
ncbi:polypeptide release factor 3 [Scheffersomyces coipomensis]|uniref:polypeptide release factor 3 n=1 Tax=Scheffersomyces coipomensis TaxID=1788519 RepID=UPI00315D71DA